MTKYKIQFWVIKDSLKAPVLDENEQEVLFVIQKFPFDTKTMLAGFDHFSFVKKFELLQSLILKSLIRLYMVRRIIIFE